MNLNLNSQLNDEERFLCNVITHKDYLDKKTIAELYNKLGDEFIFDLCKKNKIESIATESLIISLKNKTLPGHWHRCYDSVGNLIRSYMNELDRVAFLLDSYEIQLVALKNSGITRSIYPYPGSCPMGDIDVLVRKSDFRKAHDILINNAYELKFRSPLEELDIDKAEQSGGSEYQVTLSDGKKLWFELQWRPIAGRWIRPDQEPDSNELMDRSIEVQGSSVRVLSPEDNLLQVCLHTAKHTYVRAPGFRLHTDVDRIVRGCDIDWSLFRKQVVKLNVKTAVFFSLFLASELLRSPVPKYILDDFKPSKLKVILISKWLQKIGLFDPDGKKWNKLGYIIFVSLLYDSFGGLLRGIFPDINWMKSRYNIKNSLLLPYFYVYRVINLLLKRTLNK
jgi:hypothetical protein